MSNKKVIDHSFILQDYRNTYLTTAKQMKHILAVIVGLLGELFVIGVLSMDNPISIAVFPLSTVLIFMGVLKLSNGRIRLRKLENKQYSVFCNDVGIIQVKVSDDAYPILCYDSKQFNLAKEFID